MSDQPVPSSSLLDRSILWLLGGWFIGSFVLMFAVVNTFQVLKVDKLRHADKVYQEVPTQDDQRKFAVKYAANEVNRYLFIKAGYGQVFMAALLLVLVALSHRRNWWNLSALAVSLAIAVYFAFHLTPVIVDLGRQIDFLPRDPKIPQVQEFFSYHRQSTILELAKDALILVVSIQFLRSPQKPVGRGSDSEKTM